MKIRVLCVILASLVLCGLVSCSEAVKDAEFVSINENKVVSVTFSESDSPVFDMRALVAAYNDSAFVGAAEDGYKDKAGNKHIVLTYTDEETAFTLFYMGGDEFCVGGTDVDVPFVVKSKKLADIYSEAIDPTPVFAQINAELVTEVVYIKNPDAEVDSEALINAYNEATILSNAKDAESKGEVIVITMGDVAVSISNLGEGKFMVSGTDIAVSYVIESSDLADIFEQYK